MAGKNAYPPALRIPWLALYYGCFLWVPVGLAKAMARALYYIDDRYFSFVRGKVARDVSGRTVHVRFCHYSPIIYLHPLIWGNLILGWLAVAGVPPGWLMIIWFLGVLVVTVTALCDIDIFRAVSLGLAVLVVLLGAWISTLKLAWNPLVAVAGSVRALEVGVTPGFYFAVAIGTGVLVAGPLLYAWLYKRVEIDRAYVMEYRFLKGVTREQIYARSVKRDPKDLGEILLLGAADIVVNTRAGHVYRYANVPGAGAWLAHAFDTVLDLQESGERRDGGQEVVSRPEDAFGTDDGLDQMATETPVDMDGAMDVDV